MFDFVRQLFIIINHLFNLIPLKYNNDRGAVLLLQRLFFYLKANEL